MHMLERVRFVHRAWRFRQRTEPGPTRFVLSHLRRGDTALDIGANKGAYTYWMSKRCGKEGHVLAFEPQPKLADYLRQAQRAFRFEQLQIYQTGLSSRKTQQSLFRPADNPLGGASLEQMSGPGSSIVVPTETLDDLLIDSPVRPVHLIKCDVEGHEYDVFCGARRILKEDQPLLVFECQDFRHDQGQIRRVTRMLEGLGYRGFFFQSNRIRPLSQFDVTFHQAGHGIRFWDNFCFLPHNRNLISGQAA